MIKIPVYLRDMCDAKHLVQAVQSVAAQLH